jgi:hypothetical protein
MVDSKVEYEYYDEEDEEKDLVRPANPILGHNEKQFTQPANPILEHQ